MAERTVTAAKAANVVATFGSNVKMLIVDVRDTDYNKDGHIKDAINIPQMYLQFDEKIEELFKVCKENGATWLIFYCQYGQVRSVKAANAANRYINTLKEPPLLQISYLDGGFDEFKRKYSNTEYVAK